MNQNQRETLTSCLTQVFGLVDEEFVDTVAPLLRWIDLPGGKVLFREGDPDDGVYFVISGSLRVSVSHEGESRVVNEMGRAEIVGELAVLSGEPRSATVSAIRDSVLAHVSREACTEILRRQPELALPMAQIIIRRLKRSDRPQVRRQASFCLLAVTEGVDAGEFGEQLVAALDRWGVTLLVTSAHLDHRLGPGAAQAAKEDPELTHKVVSWLDDVEFWHRFVVYVADDRDTAWTRRCLRQADEVLLLARSDEPVEVHPLEQRLLTGEDTVTAGRQTLVLLHDSSVNHPSGTTDWLDRRPVQDHFHIRPSEPRDLARLARVISGNAIGLVLSGGGARGFAHLGVYRALEEAGINIDFVGGTSIGGAMGGLIAFELPAQEIIDYTVWAYGKNPTNDRNLLPLISLYRGKKLKRTVERGIQDMVGFDADISDTWRTFFCVATNLSKAREMVLRRGKLSTGMRASVSIPAALPPIIWEGDLLVDGGSFNNFPVEVMKEMDCGLVIGVDLQRERTRKYEFDEVPGTWALLRDRFMPRSKRRYSLPSLAAILMDTTVVYSSSRQGQARKAADIYLNPDLRRFPILDWKSGKKISELGYRYTVERLESMSDDELRPYRDG